jgi:hypothetical protein
LIGGAEVTGHAEAKFQKKAQQLPSSSVDPALADLEHARALAVLNSLNSAKAKCGWVVFRGEKRGGAYQSVHTIS